MRNMKASGPAKVLIFEQCGSVAVTKAERCCRLYNGRIKICHGSAQFRVADRLSLMFVATEVELVSNTDTSTLARGQGRKTMGLKAVAERSCVDIKIIKSDVARSANYLRYLALAGPGSLLEIGPDDTNR